MNLVRSWPQGQAGATPLGWSRPQPLMPPRIEGWPRGVVPSGNAEALLESAVAYWDASKYRPGDRFLRNQGVAGELLDLRLGSSVVANTNDPLYLAPEQSGYVYLPGVSGNYLSVPDEAALDITGDIDIRVKVALDDWTPAASSGLVGKFGSAAADGSYYFYVTTTGRLALIWRDSSGTQRGVDVATATGIADGDTKWVRITLDVDNGAGQLDCKAYLSDDGVTWTQLGNTSTGSIGTTSIQSGGAPLVVGARRDGVEHAAGKFYRAIVKSGIDGTTVLDVDCDAITSGSATSFTATTGQTVTINRSTSGRKSVAMPSRWNGGRPCFLFGTDDYMEVQDAWQHQLLNFGQGDSFTAFFVGRQWASAPNNGVYLGKVALISEFQGYLLRVAGSSANVGVRYGDGINAAGAAELAATYGNLRILSLVVNRAAETATVTVDTTRVSVSSTRGIGSPFNTQPFRVGRRSDSTVYGDFEFTAAAVWRRPLTAAEITTLSTYWGS